VEPGPITAAVQQSPDPLKLAMWLPWRCGRKVGRTIYAQLGDMPDEGDPLIGVMDTRELAGEAVLAHNAALRAQDA
jgi:hypothetical protein